MHITLQKRDKGQTWSSPILGQGQLDPYSSDIEQKRLMLQRFQEEVNNFYLLIYNNMKRVRDFYFSSLVLMQFILMIDALKLADGLMITVFDVFRALICNLVYLSLILFQQSVHLGVRMI